MLLAGLLSIAIPVLVHLVQRERKRVVPFPSLMFLRKVPHQSVRRRAVRHWPLLAMRIIGLILIVLAFSRPYRLAGAGGSVAVVGAREVVVLVDRSFSMAYGDHWKRAQEAARRALGELTEGDRASLVFFGDEVEIGPRSTPDRPALLHAVNAAAPGPGRTRYGPALRAAAGLLESSKLGRREIVLISDFQKSGWDRAEDMHLPSGMTLTTMTVAGEPTSNAAVVGLSFDRTEAANGERVIASARIVNHSASPLTDRELALEVDGIRVDSKRISVGAGSAFLASFAPFVLGSRPVRVTARLAHDSLAPDDECSAVVRPGRHINVLVIESSNPGPDSSLYLVRALSVGSDPVFDSTVVRVDKLSSSDIAAADLIVLNDSRPPSGAAGRALDTRVRSGRGLLVALGERSTWGVEDPDLLPGKVGEVVDHRGSRGGTLGYIDYSHPVFEIFNAPRSGDLTSPHVFRYRRLIGERAAIARFDDGGLAVAERQADRGTVMVWTSTFDSYWNDFALSPVFVPFVQQAAKHLARYVAQRLAFTIGDALDPAELLSNAAKPAGLQSRPEAEVTVFGPDGAPVSPRAGASPGVVRLAAQGFYELRPRGAGRENSGWAAVNVAPIESDLESFDPAELARAVAAPGPVTGGGTLPELTPEDRERRQAVWWYLLVIGFLLLIAETVFASRLPRIA